MRIRIFISGIIILSLALTISCDMCNKCEINPSQSYDLEAMYDENYPQPPVVTPQAIYSPVPSDAVILFDGKDLSQWVDKDGNPPKWKVEDGYMEVVKGAGEINTKQNFGSCQLHAEWAAPTLIEGDAQKRGNSGIFLMNLYEIQVLDCYNNKTYPGGMTASVYGQNPPLANACLPPGEWQTYDIIFRRPVFKNGKVVKPAVVTVFHNGVLMQDHFEIVGPVSFEKVPEYKEHADKLPIGLQDHGNPVRFRNIWIRELE